MPIAKIQLPDGRIARFEVAEGTTPEEVTAFAAKRFMVPQQQRTNQKDAYKAAADEMGPIGAGIAKAGGTFLDAWSGLKGLVGMGDDEQTRQDRAMANDALRESKPVASFLGDVGANALMMLGGGTALRGAGMAAGALNAGRTANALNAAGSALMAPTSLKQAAAAGGAFGAATTDGSIENRALAGAAGAAGGGIGYGIGKGIEALGSAAKQRIGNMRGNSNAGFNADLDQQISLSLQSEGIDFAAMPRAAQDALRNMAAQANAAGQQLDPIMAQRMADYKALGIDPLKAWVTRNPQDYMTAFNLKGVDDAVTQRWAGADAVLAGKAGSRAPDASDFQIGDSLRQAINTQDDALKGRADSLYRQFRDMGGRDIPLDSAKFNNEVAIELDKQMAGSKLPASVLGWFKKINDGTEPFTFDTAAQRLEALNKLIYSSNDRAEVYALNIVKGKLLNALEGADVPVPPGSLVPQGQQAGATQQELAAAFRDARGAAAQRFRFQEASPIHEAISTGKFTPEKLPDMIGKLRVDDLRAMAQADQAYGTNTLQTLRDAAEVFIRDKSVLQGETGGKFSQAGLRRALDQLGPENGKMLLGADRWAELQRVLRAGGNMQNQMAGIVANNSGTSQALANLVRNMPLPGVSPAVNLAMNVGQRLQAAGQAQSQLAAQIYQTPGMAELMSRSLANPRGPAGLLGYYAGAGSALGPTQ